MIQKNQTLEGENRTLGEEGVNNDQKKSDIIYGRSLFSNNFVALRMYKFCKHNATLFNHGWGFKEVQQQRFSLTGIIYKGVFFSESAINISDLQISKENVPKKYPELAS